MDTPARKETDAILEKLEKRIRKEYQQAAKEVEGKLADYLRRYDIKNSIKADQLKRGVITQKEYNEWRRGQIMMGKRWAEMRDTLANDLHNTNEIARNLVQKEMPKVYAVNHDYATFEVEHLSKMDTSYTLYNHRAVERVFRDNPKIYHDAGKRTKKRIREGLEKAWDKHQIESVMIQGIMQGESIPNLSKRLHKVTEGDYKAAIRNARTMTTGIENAGHQDAYHRANDLGIKTKNQWDATLDDRTRHSHRVLDGEVREVGEKFSNGCEYPGDPNGDPAEIYNCRCRLRCVIAGFEKDMSDLTRRNSKLGDMTYEEWKEEKESNSHSITKQDEIAQGMKWRYINEDYKK